MVYLAPWAKDAADLATDIAAKILLDCPPHLLPKFSPQNKEYVFRNGSVVRFKGTNGEHAQFLRGGEAHLVLIDEAGLVDDFEHVLLDVVAPMTLTTKGKIYIATTPARTPSHESFVVYNRMANNNAVFKFTILDAPHIDHEDKARELIRAGENPERIEDILAGRAQPETVTARREFWCEWLTDATLAVVPEFSPDAQKEIVKPIPPDKRPEFFDAYVGMDPGIKDSTGILFAYWDFKRAKLYIEDEALLNRSAAGTPNIAKVIKEKEAALWQFRQPFMRVSDTDARLIQDLWTEHHIMFSPADKGDSLGAINNMRSMIQNRQIVIDPRCVHLIQQLANAIWNSKATDLDRSPIDGHFDLVAALKYLTRHISRTRNPVPQNVLEPVINGVYHSRKGKKQKRTVGFLADTPTGRKLAGIKNE